MEVEKMLRKVASLPPEVQKEVVDFIRFLHDRYKRSSIPKRIQKKKLKQEAFIGLWKDRTDMQDSTSWVRDIRKKEWSF